MGRIIVTIVVVLFAPWDFVRGYYWNNNAPISGIAATVRTTTKRTTTGHYYSERPAHLRNEPSTIIMAGTNSRDDVPSPNDDSSSSSSNASLLRIVSSSTDPNYNNALPLSQMAFTYYKPRNVSDWDTFRFESNPTVFGKILRGESKTRVLEETRDLLAFGDVEPRAPLHGLVIPKRHIRSVMELNIRDDGEGGSNDSVALLRDMEEVAETLVREKYPEAHRSGDYVLCFHLPPFRSVDHLHLHVLAPASAMGIVYRYGKYNCGGGETHNKHDDTNLDAAPSSVRLCIGLSTVVQRLQQGLSPTPYGNSDGWGTIALDVLASLGFVLRQAAAGLSGRRK